MKLKNVYKIDSVFKPYDTVWACAFTQTSTKDAKRYFCKPVKGMLMTSNTEKRCEENKQKHTAHDIKYFVPFKKDCVHLAWSQAVHFTARKYADSEAECISLYNSLIYDAVEFHQNIIDELFEQIVE